MKVYVSSYATYNAGRLTGRWLAIADFADGDDLISAARDYLTARGEDAEELMFQDWDEVPDFMADECSPRWADIFELADRPESEREIIAAYVDHVGTYDPDEALDAHVGEADCHDDYRQLLIDQWYEVTEVLDHLAGYIDEDRVFRDMDMDYFHTGGHVFRSM